MVLRVCLGLWWMLFVSPSVVLCVFLVLFGVASDWLVSSWLRPPLVLPAPSVGPLGPSGPVSFLLVPPSGYLVVSCDGPVVMPVVWSVVTARLLSSIFLMATKASALCGALPSTPCCGCCSGAFLVCTEVFALG